MLVLKLYFEIINDYLFNFCNEKQSYYEKKSFTISIPSNSKVKYSNNGFKV